MFFFKKNGPFPFSFFFIFVFSIQLIVHINFADDWIRITDLWYQKRPLYQLSHNHCRWTTCCPEQFWCEKFLTGDGKLEVEKKKNQILTISLSSRFFRNVSILNTLFVYVPCEAFMINNCKNRSLCKLAFLTSGVCLNNPLRLWEIYEVCYKPYWGLPYIPTNCIVLMKWKQSVYFMF